MWDPEKFMKKMLGTVFDGYCLNEKGWLRSSKNDFDHPFILIAKRSLATAVQIYIEVRYFIC